MNAGSRLLPFATVPVCFGFCPLESATAAFADAVASFRVSFQTVIVCHPEMMFWTPCSVASWPLSGIGFSLRALSATTTAFARPSLAAATRVDLVARLDEHLLEDRPRLLVVPARRELLRPLREGPVLVERVQDRLVAALEEERVVVGLAAVELGDDRLLARTSRSPSGRRRRPCPAGRRRRGRRTRCRSQPMPPFTWRSYSITFASRDLAAASIAIEEPRSSETRMTTLAPLARHWSACVFCFWALAVRVRDHVRDLRLLERRHERRPILRLPADRRLRVGQQNADVCGRRPRLVGFATAAVTVTLTARAAITSATMVLFTVDPPLFVRI